MPAKSEVSYLQPLQDTFLQLNQEYQELEKLVDELFGEIDRLRSELARTQQQVHQEQQLRTAAEEQLATQSNGFELLNDQFHQQRELIEQLHQRAEEGFGRLTQNQAAMPEAERLQLQEELLEVRRQRDAILSELESTRSQSAEMEVQHEQQQQEMLANQLGHSGQLQEMRDLISQLGELGRHARDAVRQADSSGAGESAGGTSDDSAESGTDSSATTDPIVNSVVAQFAKLQKDAAKRRRRQM